MPREAILNTLGIALKAIQRQGSSHWKSIRGQLPSFKCFQDDSIWSENFENYSAVHRCIVHICRKIKELTVTMNVSPSSLCIPVPNDYDNIWNTAA